jgi:tripartite-type tricarboxylate transporter receptor subunit TctC
MNTLFINFISRHALQVLLSALSCITFDVLSQPKWPIKPITIIVSCAPDGEHDSMARILAERLTSSLGPSVIVDFKAGAQAMIGTDDVVRSQPDGHTLLIFSVGAMTINKILYEKVPYTVGKDIVLVSRDPTSAPLSDFKRHILSLLRPEVVPTAT